MKQRILRTALVTIVYLSLFIYSQPTSAQSLTNVIFATSSKSLTNQLESDIWVKYGVGSKDIAKPDWHQFKIQNNTDQKFKGYLVYKPKGYSPDNDGKHKVIVFLPPSDQPLFSIDMLTKLIGSALNKNYIVVCVHQTYQYNSANRPAVDASWLTFDTVQFSLDTGSNNYIKELTSDLKLLDIIPVKLSQDFKSKSGKSKIDSDRIYLCGWSSGAYLTQAAAMYLNHRYAAFGSNAGVAHPTIKNFKPNFKVPMIAFHATSDTHVKYGTCTGSNYTKYRTGRESAREWYRINGGTGLFDKCPNSTGTEDPKITYVKHDPIKNDGKYVEQFSYSNFSLYKIHGGGHHWHRNWDANNPETGTPCGFAQLPCDLLCRDINTSFLMIWFFELHSLSNNGALPTREFPISNIVIKNKK